MIEPLNFLMDSERRYQGPVSGRFLFVAALGTLLAAGMLSAAQIAIQYRMHRREAEGSARRLEAIRERVRRIQAQQQEAQTLERRWAELSGWGRDRPEWSGLLAGIRQATPPAIQFLQLDAQDALAVPRPAPGAAPAAGAPPPEPRRGVRLRITGRAVTPEADAVVSEFIQALERVGEEPFFHAVTLLFIQADPAAGEPTSRFELEALAAERPL